MFWYKLILQLFCIAFAHLLSVCVCRCVSCGCDPAGSVEGTLCDAVTGVCSCKLYVTGPLCDTCVPGFQQLEASNPLGCSAREWS